MNRKTTLVDELLRQNGFVSSDGLRAEQDAILEAIGKDRRRLGRFKLMSHICWALTIVLFVSLFATAAVLRDGGADHGDAATALLMVLMFSPYIFLVIAIIASIDVYRKKRSIKDREILAGLAGIEKAIRRLAEKK